MLLLYQGTICLHHNLFWHEHVLNIIRKNDDRHQGCSLHLHSPVYLSKRERMQVRFCFLMLKQLQTARETCHYSKFVDFLCGNGLVKRLQSVSSFLNLHPLCRSSCRGTYLLIQPWICCPEIGLGNKALKIGGWVTLIISANDTLTVARSTGEWRLYHVQLSKADNVCLALPLAAAFCWWVPPEIWCGNVTQPFLEMCSPLI